MRTVSVQTTTLPDVLKAMNWPRIDLMKIDIEGSEYEVFASLDQDILAAIGVIFIECHHLPGADPYLIAGRLVEAGFQVAADVASNNTMLVASREGQLEGV